MRKMKFKINRKIQKVVLSVLMGLGIVGLAALFISGGLMSTFLGVLPLIVHQIIGFAFIGAYALVLLKVLRVK